MSTGITFDALALEVIALAERAPDYTYPGNALEGGGCTYTVETNPCGVTTPACLWGQAMLNLGVPSDDLEGRGELIGRVLLELGIEATLEQTFWAMTIQTAQDSRRTWGDSVAHAGPCPLTD